MCISTAVHCHGISYFVTILWWFISCCFQMLSMQERYCLICSDTGINMRWFQPHTSAAMSLLCWVSWLSRRNYNKWKYTNRNILCLITRATFGYIAVNMRPPKREDFNTVNDCYYCKINTCTLSNSWWFSCFPVYSATAMSCLVCAGTSKSKQRIIELYDVSVIDVVRNVKVWVTGDGLVLYKVVLLSVNLSSKLQ